MKSTVVSLKADDNDLLYAVPEGLIGKILIITIVFYYFNLFQIYIYTLI